MLETDGLVADIAVPEQTQSNIGLREWHPSNEVEKDEASTTLILTSILVIIIAVTSVSFFILMMSKRKGE